MFQQDSTGDSVVEGVMRIAPGTERLHTQAEAQHIDHIF
jgi:hypothetical protein